MGPRQSDWIRQGVINRPRLDIYIADLKRFLKHTIAGIHLMGGLPLRRNETLTLRYINSTNGGLRNIFVWGGRIITRTVGGKAFWKVGERKVWRVMPVPLSRAIVTYMSVVVPFLEGLEVECLGGDGKIDFLFSQKVATKEPRLLTVTGVGSWHISIEN
ncbi:hypothetical protein F5144DRAFT_585020, partial [Chaetomium tenue]